MRTLLSLAAVIILIALPGVASAACGKSGDAASVEGRSYRGVQSWSSGTPFAFKVELRPDCTALFTFGDNPPTVGSWQQFDRQVVLHTAGKAVSYLGDIDGAAAVTGRMIDDEDEEGTFSLTLVTAAPRVAAPAPPAAPAGTCGRGDAAHPLVLGQSFHGELIWQGEAPAALTLTFKPDCSVGYVYDDGSVGSARWSQDGITLRLDVNGGHASYDGYVQMDGYAGNLRNIAGKTGRFSFVRTK